MMDEMIDEWNHWYNEGNTITGGHPFDFDELVDLKIDWTKRQRIGLFLHKIWCLITQPVWWVFCKVFDI